jgi:hypothetical protein
VGFESEIDDILRELLREPGMVAAALAKNGEDPFPDEIAATPSLGEIRRLPLGSGMELVVLLDGPAASPDLAAALERCTREVRACTRMWGRELPQVSKLGRAPRSKQALLSRITTYLEAFAITQGALGAAVLRGPEVVTVGGRLDEAHLARLAFLRKRVDAEAEKHRGKSSHAEVSGEDFYACSFWFDAYLVTFFDKPYALDFVRHRARLVTRELAALLPHLDDPPNAPAKLSPLPD